MITASGTPTTPIVIEKLAQDGPIVFDHAAYVILRGVHTGSGIILRRGSHDITLQGNTIDHARLGIWIGDGAGDGNRIEDNTITNSATHGIAVDRVNARPDHPTIIARNRIANSGVHGIELSGNDYTVEGNIVSGGGLAGSGASGIHVFAPGPGAGVGLRNIIRGNTSIGNHDASAQDGNGIQIDQWCDDNLVAGNLVIGNDGAGISIFDAARARVMGNTLAGNMRDPAHSHRHRGELVFASDDTHDADNTTGAVAEDNIVAAQGAGVAAILVDVPTARHPPRLAGNLLSGALPGRWAGRDVDTIAAWNALAPHARPDLAGTPRFVDPTRQDMAGFRLAPQSPAAWRSLGAPAPAR